MGYVDDAFDNLRTTLEITDTEAALASQRQQAIRAHLDDHWDVDEDFLTGSYRRHTKTKRLQDVDIFIVLEPDGSQGKYRDQAPSAVLNALRDVLGLKWDDVKVDRMAAVISYGDDVASFEVVPAYGRDGGGYQIPDTKRGEWIDTDPAVHAEQSTAKNKACGEKFVPFVKMIKGINRQLGEPVSPSFLLEVMAHGIVDSPFGRYQDEISWFLATAADRIDEAWPDPAGLGPDVNAEMTASERKDARLALEEAAAIAAHAVWLEDDGQERAAVEEWRKLFDWRMPRP